MGEFVAFRVSALETYPESFILVGERLLGRSA